MPNEYSRQWFDVFLDAIPPEWTDAEIEGVMRRLPLPTYSRILDVCCGPGRHARGLAAAGYDVTGIDRDAAAVAEARAAVPTGEFLQLDQRDLARLAGDFDAALILWQSFGYFTPPENDQVLIDLGRLLRPGGRLLLDLFHPLYFEQHQGRPKRLRDPRCTGILNTLDGRQLTTTIDYVDGTEESMTWELFSPDELAGRAAAAGFVEMERCTWWDSSRQPSAEEQRYQLVLQKAG